MSEEEGRGDEKGPKNEQVLLAFGMNYELTTRGLLEKLIITSDLKKTSLNGSLCCKMITHQKKMNEALDTSKMGDLKMNMNLKSAMINYRKSFQRGFLTQLVFLIAING